MKNLLFLILFSSTSIFSQEIVPLHSFPFIENQKSFKILELGSPDRNWSPNRMTIYLYKRDSVIFIGREIELARNKNKKDTTSSYLITVSINWESTISAYFERKDLDSLLTDLANDYFIDYSLDYPHSLTGKNYRTTILEVEYKKVFLRRIYKRKVIGTTAVI